MKVTPMFWYRELCCKLRYNDKKHFLYKLYVSILSLFQNIIFLK